MLTKLLIPLAFFFCNTIDIWVKILTDSDLAPQKKRFFLASNEEEPEKSFTLEFPIKLVKDEGNNERLCGRQSVNITAVSNKLIPPNKTRASQANSFEFRM